MTLINPELKFRGPVEHGAYGLVGYNEGWDSINLTLTGGTVHGHVSEDPNNPNHAATVHPIAARLVPFITTNNPVADPDRHPKEGLGRFVNYDFLNNGNIARPGRVSSSTGNVPVGNLISDNLDASLFDPNP